MKTTPVLSQEQINEAQKGMLTGRERADAIRAMLGMMIASPVCNVYLDNFLSEKRIEGAKPERGELIPRLYAELTRDAAMLVDQADIASIYLPPGSNLLVPAYEEVKTNDQHTTKADD